MVLLKTKKIFLLFLLLPILFFLSTIKFISGISGGEKTSHAQAECWTPSTTTSGWGCGCTNMWGCGAAACASCASCGCLGNA